MAVESEKTLERKLNALVDQKGGLSVKLLSKYINGLPDRMALLPGGVVFFVELKSTGQKPRRIQQYIMNKIRDLGFKVYVIDNSNDIKKITELC